MLSLVESFLSIYSRITTAKYFCIKICDLTKYFLRIDRTNGLSRAATDFEYKNSTIQMLCKSEESLTFTCKSCKRDTNRDIKLHQLRDLEKAWLIVAEDSIDDHGEATHDIVPHHWLARRSSRSLDAYFVDAFSPVDVRQLHVLGSHFSLFHSRNRILEIRGVN